MKKLLLSLFVALSGTAIVNAQTICQAATTLTTNGTYVAPAITGTYPVPTTACFQAYTSPAPKAIWYKFTPTSNGLITIDSGIAANPVGTTDTRLSIFTGTCTTLACAAANDDINAGTQDYRSRISNFAVTSGTTYYIVWDNRWAATGFSFTFNFTAVTCFAPTTGWTYTTAPTTTTASLGWTAPTGAPSGYEVEYGVKGFTQGSGTTVTTTTNSVALSNLTPSTVYEFYVRSNCGAGGYSIWSVPVTFNTVFEAANVPYNTGFEQNSLDNIGWGSLIPTGYTGEEWDVTTPGGTFAQEGANIALIFAGTAVNNAWLLSRGVNLTAGSPATVSYYVRNYLGTGSTGSGAYEVKAGTAPTIAGMTIQVAPTETISATAYAQKTFTFTPTTTGVHFIGFHSTSAANTGTQALFLDNVTVTQTLGVKDFSANKFSVYPNPSNGLVTVNNTLNALISNVQITDLNGRIIKTDNFASSTEIQVNISDLSAGVYMMSINSDQGSVTKKIVKN